MAKRRSDDGLTSDELTEVQTMEASVVRDEARTSTESGSGTYTATFATSDEELASLREAIAKAEARIFTLEHPTVEFPKMVKGLIFASREAQDAAGPEYAD